jgi:hypothetical protein
MVAAAVLSGAADVSAQSVERFSLETTASIDQFKGTNAVDRPNIVIDITASVRLGGGWQIFVRPWFRQPRLPDWDKQIYQAFVRYERQGDVAVRVDTGYLGSPIGLGLADSSPSINPTIASHSSYFSPMLPFETGGPRVNAIASSYPLGSQLTVSTDRWDVRGAVVSTAPTRIYTIGGGPDPHHTPVIEAGAGITPHIGLRFGVSFARGAYLTRDEIVLGPAGDRQLTMAGVEGEYSFGYTKLSGEFVRDRFETPEGTLSGSEWFIQGMQTLSPRWFVSGRHEGVSAPLRTNVPTFRAQPRQKIVEGTLGFRLTNEIMIRGSYLTRLSYGRTIWEKQGGAQVVWTRRWW